MNKEVEALHRQIGHAHMRIGALETMLMIFLGSQSKRDPSVGVLLREMAAGEVPDLVPDLSALPPGLSESQRAEIIANLDRDRKMTRQYMMQLADMYAEHIKDQK